MPHNLLYKKTNMPKLNFYTLCVRNVLVIKLEVFLHTKVGPSFKKDLRNYNDTILKKDSSSTGGYSSTRVFLKLRFVHLFKQ